MQVELEPEDLVLLIVMNRLIVVEGPQGTGKSTLANYFRDNIPSSNLYRLSGQKDKTITGKNISKKMYNTLLDYLKNMQEIPMDLIFDRTFFTEEVYARLGYKEYSFTDVYEDLLNKFLKLNYDIYFINLYLENTKLFEQRLKRVHHNYQSFSIDNSVNQQNVYRDIADDLKMKGVTVENLAMDDFDVAYEKVKKLVKIK